MSKLESSLMLKTWKPWDPGAAAWASAHFEPHADTEEPWAPPAPREPGELGEVVEDVLDQLLSQFTDPFSCLRELVQNAIDAGTTEISVTCTFEEDPLRNPGPSGLGSDPGTAILRIADWGEGMDRQTIDNRLTRLFSSDKESDHSKIGKFGIGFASIFALAPELVCVDTGRCGESWRVVFRPDRSFTRMYLNEPVEGTTVRLFKAMTRAEFAEFEPQVGRALARYCQHAEIALRYQGDLFSQPLGEEAAIGPIRLAVTVGPRGQETTIIVGYAPDGSPARASFHRRGLTLLRRASELPGISYLVNSPRLEHTQGRDNIVQDTHYGQLMSIVYRLAGGPLIEELSQRLEDGLHKQLPAAELCSWQRRLMSLRRNSLPPSCAGRAVACSPDNKLYTLAACEEAARQNHLYITAHASPLTAAVAMSVSEAVVLPDWQRDLAAALGRREPPRLEQVYVLPLPLTEAKDPPRSAADEQWKAAAAALCSATRVLLEETGESIAAVELGHLGYPGSGAAALPAIMQQAPFAVSRLATSLPQYQRHGGSLRTVILNVDHVTVKALLRLAGQELEFAAYHMTKLCLLGGTALSPELDSRLLRLAMESRCPSLQ